MRRRYYGGNPKYIITNLKCIGQAFVRFDVNILQTFILDYLVLLS